MPVRTEVTTITPAMAKRLLEKNIGNRNVRQTAIARYAQDMTEENWVVNGEAIVVGSDGTLLDGQNRLMACVQAKVPFNTVFVTGLNGKARETIDIGIPRTLADALTWHGVANPVIAASALNFLQRYDLMIELGTKQLIPSGRRSRQEMLDIMDANPGIAVSSQFAEEYRRRIPAALGIVAATHFLITRSYSQDQADEFYGQVADPTGTTEESPAFILREWLLDHQTLMTRKSPTVIWAMNIKAARFWLQGVTVKRLAWKRTTQRKGEEFPRIDVDVS